MKRIVSTITATAACLWLTAASALGLGEIQVRSHLNERFDAVIPLTSLGADDADNVRVALAGADEFARAGIERPDYLSSLHFAVKTADGAPRIEVSSAQIEREPYLQLLLEVHAGGSRILRQYTVLMDPPELVAHQPATVAGAAAPAAAPAPLAPASSAAESSGSVFVEVQHPEPPADERRTPRREVVAPAKPALRRVPASTAPSAAIAETAAAPAPAAAAAPADADSSAAGDAGDSGALYGPVKPAETLWSIATRMRGDSKVTMDQVLLAIYNSNPRAFDGGIDHLLRGALLHVPSVDEMSATGAEQAHERVMQLRGLRSGATPAPRPSRPVIDTTALTAPPPATAALGNEAAPKPAPAPLGHAAPAAGTPPPGAVPEAAASGAATASAGTAPAPATGAGSAGREAGSTPDASDSEAATPTLAPDGSSAAPTAGPTPAGTGSSLLQSLLIPLAVGLLVLIGIALLLSRWRSRRTRPVTPVVSQPRRPLTPAASASEMAVAAAAAGAAAPARKLSPQEELDLLQSTVDEPVLVDGTVTQHLHTQQIEAGVAPDHESVHVEVRPAHIDPQPQPQLPPVEFDLTGQFASQTVQIDLDANDPVSEADFHLAYGLYDEAALLLRQAALEHPERTDIEVKLAETYFAAGKTAEFEATAAAVKPRLSAADWQKLAIMGQQLDPGSGLFKDAAQAPLVADVDLSFVMPDKAPPASSSEPRTAESLTAAPEPASVNFEFGTMPLQESTATASRTRPARDDKGLDFRLDELELPSLDAASGPPPAAGDPLNLATDPEGDDMLDFDLGSFDLDPPPAAPASATPPAEGNASVDFDLGDFDLAEPAAPAAPASQPGFGAMTPEPLLDEFDFDAESAESADISGDEAGTKLDLARAYVEMGDNEMAHSLLGEVLMQGSEQQRRDAQALLGRLV